MCKYYKNCSYELEDYKINGQHFISNRVVHVNIRVLHHVFFKVFLYIHYSIICICIRIVESIL